MIKIPYTMQNKPKEIDDLSKEQQKIWISTFNKVIKDNDEEKAFEIAWSSVKSKNLKMNEYHYVTKLNEDLPESIEIMRHGKWKHPTYGKLEINDSTFNDIINNFKANVRGIDVSFDIEHGMTGNKSEAVCWVKNIKKRNDKLLAFVDWTELGKEKIKNKQFKYFSPEFKRTYENVETGEKFKNVLFGGGLTNRPFIKNMNPIMLSENIDSCEYNNIMQKEENILNKALLKSLKLSEEASETDVSKAIDEIIKNNVTLSETNDKLTKDINTITKNKDTLEIKLNELKDSKTTSDKEIIKLNEQIDKINTKLLEEEWKTIETLALNEGKFTQPMIEKFKTRFMKDQEGTKELIDCLQPVVTLDEQGTSQGNNDDVNHMKLFEEKIEEIEKNDKVTYAKAVILAEQKYPELFEKANVPIAGGVK